MKLSDLLTIVDGLGGWSHADKIKLFAWYLHTYESRMRFTAAEIASCYDQLNAAPPSNIAPFLAAMEKRKPKEALKDASGYRLENRVRRQFDERFGQRTATVQVHKILTELPAKIPALAERAYLEEALICFRHRAFR